MDLNLSLYTILKTVHVLAAAVWVGTAVQQQLAAARAGRTNDPQRMVDFLDEAEWLGKRLFAPAAGVAFLAGIAMVLTGDGPAFEDLWIVLGIAIFLTSSVVGARYLTPESGRLRALVAEQGLQAQPVQERIARITTVTRIDLALLTLAVIDMVLKPTL